MSPEEYLAFFDRLRKENLVDGVPEEVVNQVFTKAWEDGHASGLWEVEMHYGDLALIVNAAFDAGMREAHK